MKIVQVVVHKPFSTYFNKFSKIAYENNIRVNAYAEKCEYMMNMILNKPDDDGNKEQQPRLKP